MFCPECRRYWNAPAESSGIGKGKRQASTSCQVCGSLLARDRLVSEFPPPEQAHATGRVTDKRLTIEDVLRETAGDKTSTSSGAVLPLDDRLRRRPSILPLRNKNAGWEHDDTPRDPE